MRIALLVVVGLIVGVLGGAALGVALGLLWIEIFDTSSFEGYSSVLVFFTFMPAGAAIGGLGGAVMSGRMAFRTGAIAHHQGRVDAGSGMQKKIGDSAFDHAPRTKS
jgi:NhaP-type Na+/H+ or K+/H+ antiporter